MWQEKERWLLAKDVIIAGIKVMLFPACFKPKLSLASSMISVCMLLFASCGTSLSLKNHGSRHSYRVIKDVVYTPESWPEQLPANIYRPKSNQPTPAVLLVHGGSWALGDDRHQVSAIARRLARRGYLVMNVTYRMIPEWSYPDLASDLRQALHWLRDHADELNVDTRRVGVFGYSAGGQLAAMLGLDGGVPGVRVKAIVAGSTPHDMTLIAHEDVVKVLLRGTYEEFPRDYQIASPLCNVSTTSPPMFLYHGSKDKVVLPLHTERMQKELEKKGVRHEVHWVKGRGHVSTFLFPGKAIGKALNFLDRELVVENTGD